MNLEMFLFFLLNSGNYVFSATLKAICASWCLWFALFLYFHSPRTFLQFQVLSKLLMKSMLLHLGINKARYLLMYAKQKLQSLYCEINPKDKNNYPAV